MYQILTAALIFLSFYIESGRAEVFSLVRIAVGTPIEQLDPALYFRQGERQILHNLTDTLVSINQLTGKVQPQAAKSYRISEDGKTYTFDLRSDLKWSNGSKITAHDFVRGLKRIIATDTRSPHAKKLASVAGALEAQSGILLGANALGLIAVSANIVQIKLRVPDTLLLYVLSQPFCAPISEQGLAQGSFSLLKGREYLSSGPYTLVEQNKDGLLFKPNSQHRRFSNKKGMAVRVKAFDDAAVAFRALLSGQEDIMGHQDFSVPSADQMQLHPSIIYVQQPDASTLSLRMNIDRDAFADPHIRSALGMALDRDLLAGMLLLPFDRRAYSILPYLGSYYDAPTTYLFDPARAQTAFEQSEYCNKQPSAKPCAEQVQWELLVEDNDIERKMGLALISAFNDILKLKQIQLRVAPKAEVSKMIATKNYDLVIERQDAQAEYPFAILENLESNHDAFVKKTFRASPVELKNNLRNLEVHLMADDGVIPLVAGTTTLAMRKPFAGFVPNVFDLHAWADIYVQP